MCRLPVYAGGEAAVGSLETAESKKASLLSFSVSMVKRMEVPRPPPPAPRRKLSEKLLTLKRSGHLSEAVYNKIRPRRKRPPRIYGLPEIHKADVPLRPTVSCVNTFAYDFSAYLANILSPLNK